MRVQALVAVAILCVACSPQIQPPTDGPLPGDMATPPDPIDAGGQRLKFVSPEENGRTEGDPLLLRGDCEPGGSLVRVSGQFVGSPLLVTCDPANSGTFNLTVMVANLGSPFIVQAAQTGVDGVERLTTRSLRLSVCPKKTMGNIAVRADYTPDDQGEYCLVHNETGAVVNFDVDGRVEMPDPSIVKIDDTYYATGTWNEYNFRVYKSTDLVSWTFHSFVFDNDAANNLGNAMKIGSRKFCHLWAASIYRDPGDPLSVYVSFTAVEELAGFSCGPSTDLNTVFMTKTSTSNFKAGGNFDTNIVSYEYQLSGGGTSRRVGCDIGAQYIIPVTGSPLIGLGSSCGDLIQRTNRFCFMGAGCNAWMALDSFVFFDPNLNNRRWMLYSWIDDLTSEPVFRGNHVAARPMATNEYMDAVAPIGDLIPIAYMKNDHYPLGATPNGCFGATGPMSNYCVAEAPSATYFNGFYYVFFSRNAWDSPAYGTYYRFLERTGAQTFADLAAKNSLGDHAWSNSTIDERVLVHAESRQTPNGRSFGHGEFFIGPGDRPYFIFHAKVASGPQRTPYFKELYQGADGVLTPFTDSAANGPRSDARTFLVPRPE